MLFIWIFRRHLIKYHTRDCAEDERHGYWRGVSEMGGKLVGREKTKAVAKWM
jgi:hypothetical protein